MDCEVCGQPKRDLLLRPIECDCYNRYVELHASGSGDDAEDRRVLRVGRKENNDDEQ